MPYLVYLLDTQLQLNWTVRDDLKSGRILILCVHPGSQPVCDLLCNSAEPIGANFVLSPDLATKNAIRSAIRYDIDDRILPFKRETEDLGLLDNAARGLRKNAGILVLPIAWSEKLCAGGLRRNYWKNTRSRFTDISNKRNAKAFEQASWWRQIYFISHAPGYVWGTSNIIRDVWYPRGGYI